MSEDKKKSNSRKPYCRKITVNRFIKAVKGTGGLKGKIAEKLGCHWQTVYEILKRKTGRWPEAKQAYDEECEKIADNAEETIQHAIEQREDLPLAANTSKWYLTKKHPDRGYADVSKLKVEGGEKPIQIQTEHRITIDDLKLPLETRKQILEALREKEADEKEKARKLDSRSR